MLSRFDSSNENNKYMTHCKKKKCNIYLWFRKKLRPWKLVYTILKLIILQFSSSYIIRSGYDDKKNRLINIAIFF